MTLKLSVILVGMMMTAGAAPKIQVQGHRGARAVLPENTIPAFEYAIHSGADVLELDLAVTRDGILVVSHDPHLNRAICKGPEGENAIHKLTLEQVRQWDCGSIPNKDFPKQKAVPGTKVPTLDEVLGLAPKGRFEYNIETKIDPKTPELAPAPDEFVRLLVAAIRKHKLEKRVMVQSFDFRTLAEMKKQAPDIRTAALYVGPPKDFVEISREASGAKIVSPQYLLVSKEQVDRAHAAGLIVVPWTANNAGAWDKLIEAGVDAIISDDPAALIAHLKSKGLR